MHVLRLARRDLRIDARGAFAGFGDPIVFLFFGTFLRGPGWNWFWFWEKWDPHKVEALTNVDLPYLFGVRDKWTATIVGALFALGVSFGSFYLFYTLLRVPLPIGPWGI